MAPYVPIKLMGDNLGKRHRELNSVVSKALSSGEPIEDILKLPENSAIDRLFKIDLASKQKNVQYILQNLKEADMLYVNRALKAKWLLEEQYKDFMNPVKLESTHYPEMLLPAVNKMRHWIHLNLRDEVRSLEFFEYYCGAHPKLAMKYLLKCNTDTVLVEMPNFIKPHYMTPHYFKMFCERTPVAALTFYDLLEEKNMFRQFYADHQCEFYHNLKCILKTNPDIFLDIIEKHFNVHKFSTLSSAATRFIMTRHKGRFLKKPELYTAWFLDVPELAKCLTRQECENLVIHLARAKYLKPWFNYKSVEPLIKRLETNKRAEFKKRVFVTKDVGADVNVWPYPPPSPVIDDEFFYEDDVSGVDFKWQLYFPGEFKVHYSKASNTAMRVPKTSLNILFDEYRFKSFSDAMFELSKKLQSESVPQKRTNMMLVLISKSGGNEANLDRFFQLLLKHRNEPPQVRAAIVRSLVRRAFIWRCSDGIWKNFIEFGKGLGLDGGIPEAECIEGLHGVVIHSLLKTGLLSPEIKSAFLKNFTPLIDYKLTSAEKKCILELLSNLLLGYVNTEDDGEMAANIMEKLLDTLEVTENRKNFYGKIIPAVKTILEKDLNAGKQILKRLFASKIGRKDLIKQNFLIIQNNDSYVNALNHDIGMLSFDNLLQSIVSDKVSHERFFRKLSVYFAEEGGLASSYLEKFKKVMIDKSLARPIAYLIGADITPYILDIDVILEDCKADNNIKAFCVSIRANAHLARPEFDLNSFTWRQAGLKMVANKILVCKGVDVDDYIEQSLSWKRSARLAAVLAKRTVRRAKVLNSIATMRPTVAIQVALHYFKDNIATIDIWNATKPLLLNIDTSCEKNFYLLQSLEKFKKIPESVRPEFIQIMFPIYVEKLKQNVKSINNQSVYASVLIEIHKLLPKMDEMFIENILHTFLQRLMQDVHGLAYGIGFGMENADGATAVLYLRIMGKYVLLSMNEKEQNERVSRFVDVFFNTIKAHLENSTYKNYLVRHIKVFLWALKSYSIFFSTNNYASCLPAMQKIVLNMRSLLPIEQHFNLYVEIHLTMLYYKAVKQSIKYSYNVFANFGDAKDQKKNKEGMALVAERFGRYIACDVRNLKNEYFDSIVGTYSELLMDYFYNFKEPRHALSLPLVKGVVDGSQGIEGLVAVYLFKEYNRKTEDWDKIRDLMTRKFDKNMMFFFHEMIINPKTFNEWM